MFQLKGIALAVLLVNSSVAFSGAMGPLCEQGIVTVPCALNTWSIGGSALYLQPSFGGNGLGYTAYSNYSGNDNNGIFTGISGAPDQMVTIFPKWGWGGQLYGAYHFNANDLVFNWYHLKTRNQGHFPVGYAFSGNNDGFYASDFQVSTHWDEAEVELGQKIQLSDNKLLRLHGGVEFARIKNQFYNVPMLHPTSVVAYSTNDTLSYNGFGPRLGIDIGYLFKEHLELYAKIAGSMLIGTAKQQNSGYQNYPYPNNPISPFVTGNYYQSLTSIVVPELAAKLGAQYDLPLEHYLLSFDIGYMWVNYLDAIMSYSGNGIVFANVGTNLTANFNLNGMYLGMKLTGDA